MPSWDRRRDKAALQGLVVQELDLLRDVAVVAHGLVEVENEVETVLGAPAYELVDFPEAR